MKSQRGSANLLKFNADREERNIPLIMNELDNIRHLKLEFKTPGRLVEYLSAKTGIHRTTISRNANYKQLILDFYVKSGGNIVDIKNKNPSVGLIETQLIASQLESSNLRQEISQLEATNRHIKQISSSKSRNTNSSAEKDYIAFVDTAMALTAVLELMQDTIIINLQKKTIEDLAAPPSRRIIVGPERASAYIAWLQDNNNLLLEAFNNDKSE